MKKNSHIPVLMLSSFFLYFVSCDNQNDTMMVGSSLYKDNYVTFQTLQTLKGDDRGNLTSGSRVRQWEITGGDFRIERFDVTDGQDPNNYLKRLDWYKLDKNQRLLFVLGRKGSKELAANFNSYCPPEQNTYNKKAGELNFWIRGPLYLTFGNGEEYLFELIYLAQHSSGTANVWWFGADGMTNSAKPIFAYDPYSSSKTPIDITEGTGYYGYISPMYEPNLIFKFERGSRQLMSSNDYIYLIGVYTKNPPAKPWQ